VTDWGTFFWLLLCFGLPWYDFWFVDDFASGEPRNDR
jgi:hypothetical protein